MSRWVHHSSEGLLPLSIIPHHRAGKAGGHLRAKRRIRVMKMKDRNQLLPHLTNQRRTNTRPSKTLNHPQRIIINHRKNLVLRLYHRKMRCPLPHCDQDLDHLKNKGHRPCMDGHLLLPTRTLPRPARLPVIFQLHNPALGMFEKDQSTI